MTKAHTLIHELSDPYQDGIWVRCHCCEDYLCSIHGVHVHDCACPPIESWGGVTRPSALSPPGG